MQNLQNLEKAGTEIERSSRDTSIERIQDGSVLASRTDKRYLRLRSSAGPRQRAMDNL